MSSKTSKICSDIVVGYIFVCNGLRGLLAKHSCIAAKSQSIAPDRFQEFKKEHAAQRELLGKII
jgi:hypothetical protein